MAPHPFPPAVLVHGLSDARIALDAAAEAARGVTLLSAPAAAAHGGVVWFRELLGVLAAERPDVAVVGVLDCDDRAGDAQSALAAGVPHVLYTGPTDVAQRLADIAGQTGAVLLTERPPALDLRGHRNPAVVCRAWLLGVAVPER